MEKFKSLFLLGTVLNEAGVPELKDNSFIEHFPHLFKAASPEETLRELLERTISIARTAQAEIGGKTEAEALAYFIKNGIAPEKAPVALERVQGVLDFFEVAEICQPRAEKITELVAEAIATYPEINDLISEEDRQAPDALSKQLTAVQVYLADLTEQASSETADETAPATETPETPAAETTPEVPVTETAPEQTTEPVMETPTEETPAQEEPGSNEPASDTPVVAEEGANLPAPVELNLANAHALGTATLEGVAKVAATNVAINQAMTERAQAILSLAGEISQLATGGQQMNKAVIEAVGEAAPSIPASV